MTKPNETASAFAAWDAAAHKTAAEGGTLDVADPFEVDKKTPVSISQGIALPVWIPEEGVDGKPTGAYREPTEREMLIHGFVNPSEGYRAVRVALRDEPKFH